jgi:arylsulfatase A-like enzyme
LQAIDLLLIIYGDQKMRNRREFCRSIGLGLSVLAFQGCVKKQSTKKPNILFVFADQLRAAALSVYGGKNISTPNLDKLANQGVQFTNAVPQCPLCTPFRGTVMSGRYPTHTGILINDVRAYPKHDYIARTFKNNGYRTGFIGKWHLNSRSGSDDHNYIPPGPDRLGFDHWEAYNYMHTFNDGFYYRDEPKKLEMDKFETDFETDRAIAFMGEQKNSDSPFFLMVAPHPPHPPFNKWNCPAGYWKKIDTDFEWRPNVDNPEQWQESVHGYYALIKNFDDNIGRMMDFLEQEGLAGDTIFVFTSDHGEMMGSHDMKGKTRPYAEAVNIPMIMRWPGHIPAGTVTDELHSSMDHYPTLCSMAGIQYPTNLDGIDRSDVWQGKKKNNRTAVLMANYASGSRQGHFTTGTAIVSAGDAMEWRAVKTKRYTFVQWLDGKEELFDNIADPYQMENLAKFPEKHHEVLQDMRRLLGQELDKAHDKLRPGTYYADWYDEAKIHLKKTALGKV